MRRIFSYRLIIIAVIVLMFHSGLVSAADPPKKGGVLPQIDLPIPQDPAQSAYLGLSGEGQFKIPQIKAEAVIIEIFSMYCPHCQGEAPRVNQLYQIIEETPKFKGKLKVIGIGVGNSSFEVEVFRKNYEVLFPLFPDGDFSIHERLGAVRTPYFIGVKIKDDGTHEVFYSKLGGFDKADEFLQLMVKLCGCK
jgi:thiol-disulfide isomerase/thioredoxin